MTRLGVTKMHKVSKICCDHFLLTYRRNTEKMTTVTAPMTITQILFDHFIYLDKDYKFTRENFQLSRVLGHHNDNRSIIKTKGTTNV
jgi:hypothetical protein